MIADFLSLNDARWQRFLDRAPHDAYHLPAYCRVAGNYECGEPVAFYVEEGEHALLMPLLVRELPSDLNGPDTSLFCRHDSAKDCNHRGEVIRPTSRNAIYR